MYFRPPTTGIGSSNGYGNQTSFEFNKFHINTRETLAVVQVNNTLTQEESGHLYEVEPNYLLTNKYPNLYIIPTIHYVDLYKSKNVPLVVINFLKDNIYLPKGEIMGFMQCQSLDISEVITETSTEPSSISLDEDNHSQESRLKCKMEAPFKPNEKEIYNFSSRYSYT